MAEVPKIRVMISSRSMSEGFKGIKLVELRRALKQRLESLTLDKRPVFDVWIHEDDPAPAGGRTILQGSIDKIIWADIVLVLYTGAAGTVGGARSYGICHEELREALSRRRNIVTLIELAPVAAPANDADRRFQDFVRRQQLIGNLANDRQSLLDLGVQLVHHRTARLARRGATMTARRADQGTALDWTRLGLDERRSAMREALSIALGGAPGSNVVVDRDTNLLQVVDAIPASWSTPAARELVGQPFLRDHEHAKALQRKGIVGPLHLLACHRGVTEAQALRMLGTPDAVAVTSDFGVFVADRVSKVQVALFANCLDESAVQSAVRYWREWLTVSDEGSRLLERAAARRDIVQAIARGLGAGD